MLFQTAIAQQTASSPVQPAPVKRTMISNSPTLAQMVFCSVVMILQFAEAGRFATRQRRARLGHRFAVG